MAQRALAVALVCAAGLVLRWTPAAVAARNLALAGAERQQPWAGDDGGAVCGGVMVRVVVEVGSKLAGILPFLLFLGPTVIQPPGFSDLGLTWFPKPGLDGRAFKLPCAPAPPLGHWHLYGFCIGIAWGGAV